MPPFSERHGFLRSKSIRYREELPGNLRGPIIDLAVGRTGSAALRKIVTSVLDPYGIEPPLLLISPPPISVSPFSTNQPPRRLVRVFLDTNLDFVLNTIEECHWYRVYDVVESIYQFLTLPDKQGSITKEQARQFESELNEYFVYAEIGWQLRNGVITTRGDETFESTVNTAVSVLEEGQKPTAAKHLQFAIGALSTRPKPNTSGAVAHATNAVECVLGEVTGETMTLGDYLKRNPGLFHPALKKGLDGVYGYASDEGARHGKEGTEPSREEAEFIVATCAAVCTLFARKHPK